MNMCIFLWLVEEKMGNFDERYGTFAAALAFRPARNHTCKPFADGVLPE